MKISGYVYSVQNRKRVKRGRAMLGTYALSRRDIDPKRPTREDITDAVADLLHLAARHGIAPADITRIASYHFADEGKGNG